MGLTPGRVGQGCGRDARAPSGWGLFPLGSRLRRNDDERGIFVPTTLPVETPLSLVGSRPG